jgi:hypothetical protein
MLPPDRRNWQLIDPHCLNLTRETRLSKQEVEENETALTTTEARFSAMFTVPVKGFLSYGNVTNFDNVNEPLTADLHLLFERPILH